jgi:transposase-like protein
MRSVAGGGGQGKKRRRLGEPTVVGAEEFAGMELDAKVELIRALIPFGLKAAAELLDDEVTELAGARYRRDGGQPGLARHGRNRTSVRLGGPRVPLRVPRVRNLVEGREVPLASLRALRAAPGAVDETLLRRVLYGLSCHNYEAAAEAVPGAIGLSPSSVSRQFIEASAAKLRELSERDLSGFDLVALVLDGKTFAQDTMVTALGVTLDGQKVILGFVEASTENAEVLTPFLRGLVDRGLKVEQGLLVVLDGGKGLRAAVRRALGNKALVHRCQWHKRENVVDHLSKGEQAWWRKRLQRAYERPTYEEAKTALKEIRRDLEERNLSAAGSLDEGFEETLTLHRLGVFPLVGISLKTTNCLESIFSQVETRTGRVGHWKNSSQKHRWLAAALLDIEPRLRRLRGYQHLPRLREAIQRELSKPGQETHEADELAGKEVA